MGLVLNLLLIISVVMLINATPVKYIVNSDQQTLDENTNAKTADENPVKTVVVEAEFDPHPQYVYAYDVVDDKTGDSKSHEEVRDGDVVKGSYSFIDPTGRKITVKYTADGKSGFKAVILKEPLASSKKFDTKISNYF